MAWATASIPSGDTNPLRDYQKALPAVTESTKRQIDTHRDVDPEGAGIVVGAVIGGIKGAIASGAVLSWATAGYAALGAGLAYAQQALAPDAPSHGSGANSSSPTYGFDNVGASFSPLGEPISIVYGEERPQLKRIQEFTRRIGGQEYAYALYAVAQGPITSYEQLWIEGQPIENYDDVTVWSTLGDGENIEGFEDEITQTNAQGKTISTDETVITTSGEPDRISTGVIFPQGLNEIGGGGNAKKQTVNIEATYRNRSTGEEIEHSSWIDAGTAQVSFTAKQTQEYNFQTQQYEPVGDIEHEWVYTGLNNEKLLKNAESVRIDGDVKDADALEPFYGGGIYTSFLSGLVRRKNKTSIDAEEVDNVTTRTTQAQWFTREKTWEGTATVDFDFTTGFYRVRDNSTSTVRREFEFDVPERWRGDKIDVILSRENSESSDPAVSDSVELNYIREREFSDNDYSDYAMVGVRIKAEGQLSGTVPSLEAQIRGRPAHDSTPSSETGWTDNPWICLYDALVSGREVGLSGYDADELDWPSFRDAADFSDEMVSDGQGGTEKRHRLNLVIDQKMEIQKLIDTVSTAGQGYTIWDTNGIHVVLDEPDLDPVMVFNEQNMIGPAQYSFKPAKKDYEAVEVQFRDENSEYEQTIIEVPKDEGTPIDDRFPKQTLNLIGVTNRAQAIRTARLMQRIDDEERLTCSLTAPQEAVHVQPGDLCYVADVVSSGYWQYNGRIRDYGPDYVLLDQQVDISASEIDIILRLKDGRIVNERIEGFGSTSDVVKLNRSFNDIGEEPLDNCPFAIGPVDEITDLMRVRKITHTQTGDLELEMVEHSETKFIDLDDFDLDAPQIDASLDTNDPKPVEELRGVSRTTFNQDGTLNPKAEIAWSPPLIDNASRYDVWIDYDATTTGGGLRNQFEKIKEADGLSTIVSEGIVAPSRIRVLVQTITEDGKKLPLWRCPIVNVSIRGLSGRPPDVQSLSIRQRDQAVILDWPSVDYPLHDHYQVRRGSSWSSGQVVRDDILNSRLEVQDVVNRDYTYHVKSISSQGKESKNAASASITVTGIKIDDFILDADEAPDWNGTKDGFAIVSRSEGESIAPIHNQRWSDIWGPNETWSDQYGPSEEWDLGFRSECIYTTQTKDIGRIRETNVNMDVALFADLAELRWSDAYGINDVWDDAFDEGESGTWLDLGENALDLEIEYRISDDNSTWSSWQTLEPEKRSFRYIEFRVTVRPNSLEDDIYIYQMLSLLNIRDVILEIENFTIQSGGTTLDYSNFNDQTGVPGFFLNEPKIAQLQGRGNNQAVAFEVANKTNTDMDLMAYDTTDGTSIQANADIEIRGI